MDQTNVTKERVAGSPVAWGILGGLATWAIGTAYQRYSERNRYRRVSSVAWPYEEDVVGAEGSGYRRVRETDLRERASETASDVRDRVSERAAVLKDRAAEQFQTIKGRMSASVQRAEERPLLLALGGLSLGAALGLLLPLSDRERQFTAPIREKAKEQLGNAVDVVRDKVDMLEEKAADPGMTNPNEIGIRPF